MKRLTVTLFLLVAGCGEPIQYATPSGQPEIRLAGNLAKKTKNILINQLLDNGYSLINDTDTMVTLEKPMEPSFAAMMASSRFNSQPCVRVMITLLESERMTRVVANPMIVSNPHSGFEHRTRCRDGQTINGWQRFLFDIKKQAETATRPVE